MMPIHTKELYAKMAEWMQPDDWNDFADMARNNFFHKALNNLMKDRMSANIVLNPNLDAVAEKLKEEVLKGFDASDKSIDDQYKKILNATEAMIQDYHKDHGLDHILQPH